MNRTLSVAPMMGYTDRHCRYLFRLITKNSMLYSEMITSSALFFGDHEKLLIHSADEPVGIQLGGNNPKELAYAAALAETAGYQEVNLNCGCPSDRVQNAGIGACMMERPKLSADCYRAIKETVKIPVTIKSRIGVNQNTSYGFFHDFISSLYEAGCRNFFVHARIAILKGLTPRQNREVPPLRYDYVKKIQEEFSDASFFLNGGIKDYEEAKRLLKNYAGVMLGRAAYKNPMIMHELDIEIFGGEKLEMAKVITSYGNYMEYQLSKGTPLRHMAKHLAGLFHGIRKAASFRRELNSLMCDDSPNPLKLHSTINQLKKNIEKDHA